jgi:hypothetical protein
LGVFTRKQGEALVRTVNKRGTSFTEMMNFVFNQNGQNRQYMFTHSIRTLDHVKDFFEWLDHVLCDDCCTIVKLMRYPENINPEHIPLCNYRQLTSGHSIIFSKKKGGIYSIDPQQETYRKSDNLKKVFDAWQSNCYVEIALMFNKQQTELEYGPMDIVEPTLEQLPDHGPIQSSELMSIEPSFSTSSSQPMSVEPSFSSIHSQPMSVEQNYYKSNSHKSIKRKTVSNKKRKNSKKSRSNHKKRI